MGLFQIDGGRHHCRDCEHWGDIPANSAATTCLRGAPRVQAIAMPEYGCAFWVRAIGADDDLDGVSRRETDWFRDDD